MYTTANASFFKDYPLFKNLSTEEAKIFIDEAINSIEKYSREGKNYVLKQGESFEDKGLYLVVSGQFYVTHTQPGHDPVVSAPLDPKDFFGLGSLLSLNGENQTKKRNASVECRSEYGEVCHLSSSFLREVLKNEGLRNKVYASVIEYTRELNARTEDLIEKNYGEAMLLAPLAKHLYLRTQMFFQNVIIKNTGLLPFLRRIIPEHEFEHGLYLLYKAGLPYFRGMSLSLELMQEKKEDIEDLIIKEGQEEATQERNNRSELESVLAQQNELNVLFSNTAQILTGFKRGKRFMTQLYPKLKEDLEGRPLHWKEVDNMSSYLLFLEKDLSDL